MGGYGSGGYYRSSKTKTNDCRFLDINKMVKAGSIPKSGYRSGSWVWTDAETGERLSAIGYSADTIIPHDSYLRIFYTITSSGQKIDYKVPLARTYPRYGGERLWFICPATRKRVAKLYLHPGGDIFASRQAYRLSYASQSETSYDRAIRKMWKLKNRLGGEDYYFRPKGMHQKTFDRLINKTLEAEEQVDGLFLVHFRKFAKRVGMPPII